MTCTEAFNIETYAYARVYAYIYKSRSRIRKHKETQQDPVVHHNSAEVSREQRGSGKSNNSCSNEYTQSMRYKVLPHFFVSPVFELTSYGVTFFACRLIQK